MGETRGTVIIRSEKASEVEPYVYVCQVCEREFKYKHYLMEHMYTHSSIKKHSCPYCNFAFHQLSNLKKHAVRKHPGKPPLLCACGKGFFQATHLRHHYDIAHNGKTPERPKVLMPDILRPEVIKSPPKKKKNKPNSDFQCCICAKLFSRRDSLKSHELIHLGSKLSKCLYCEYSCNQLSNLKRHVMRIHPGKPPLMCPQCGIYFHKSYELRKHRSTVHLEKYRDIRPHDPIIVSIEVSDEA